MRQRLAHPFWLLQNIGDATGGQWLTSPKAPTYAQRIWHDTREIQPGDIYLAIKGENFDGHEFIAEAFRKGACAAIVAKSTDLRGTPGPCLQVNCTVATLQNLAKLWRKELLKSNCQIIAVVGSNGKTTVRHVTHQTLETCGLQGSQSPKSFNNHLGLPLTILAAKHSHDYVICELGTNHPGEIALLGSICKPDHAILTSIGEEHLEFFHDLTGVAKEEAAIAQYIKPNGVFWIETNASALTLPYEVHPAGLKRVLVTDHPGIPADLPLPGEYGKINAAFAAHVAAHFNCATARISEALSQCNTPDGRWQRIPCQGGHIIHDAYNANPSSMSAALLTLSELPNPTRKVAILGDMNELGNTSETAHLDMLKTAQNLNINTICIGKAFAEAARKLNWPSAIFPTWQDNTASQVAKLLEPNDTILLKASRGQRLERLIPTLTDRLNRGL